MNALMKIWSLFFLVILLDTTSYAMTEPGVVELKGIGLAAGADSGSDIDVSRDVMIELLQIREGDTAGTARVMCDLEQIRNLQGENCVKPEEETKSANVGFLKTVSSLDSLKNMALGGGIFVLRLKHNQQIIGYLLPLSRTLACTLGGETRRSMCDAFDQLAGVSPYCQLGQICIARAYRNKGFARKLFQAFFKAYLAPEAFSSSGSVEHQTFYARYHVFFVMIPPNNLAARKFFTRMGLKRLDTDVFSDMKLPYDIFAMDLRPGCLPKGVL